MDTEKESQDHFDLSGFFFYYRKVLLEKMKKMRIIGYINNKS